MTVTVTFDDIHDITDGMEQLGRLVRGYADLLAASATAEALQYQTGAHPAEDNSAPQAETPDVPAEAPQEAKAEPGPAAEKAAQKPAEAPQETPAAPAIDESYRAEVRKVLTRLNKTVSGNPAAQLIQEVSGKRRLTDVPLELLPDLMGKAKEALKDAG